MADPEYVQLSSWEELIAWLESYGWESPVPRPAWNPKPKRKKKGPPQEEGLF